MYGNENRLGGKRAGFAFDAYQHYDGASSTNIFFFACGEPEPA